MKSLLEIKDGCFSYGEKEILHNISFSVEEHDIFTILGRNGAGKTTLFKCIMGMLKWKRGNSFFEGRKISEIPERDLWQCIAYVPQAKQAFDINVREMVVLGRSAHITVFKKPSPEDYAIADEVMKALSIDHLRKKSCRHLSGGELQMVLIARALAAKPKVLVMDEPESNLDYRNQLKILDTVAGISRSTACVINTHYPEHALRYATKSLILMPDGTSVSGPVSEVLTESILNHAFGVNVYIGTKDINQNQYKYIIPVS